MKIKTIMPICLFMLCTATSVVFAFVMGEDNRKDAGRVAEQTAAIRQTGLIRIEGEQFVSGLLGGRNCDVVISAGHAAIHWRTVARKGWRKGEMRGQGSFRFNAEPRNKSGWRVMRLVSSGYETDENIGKDEHDWSIFRLDLPAMSACEEILSPQQQPSCETNILMSGFHFDRPGTKLIEQGCRIKRTVGKAVMVHDCDSKDGSSGAPLFCQVDGKLTLMALNISGLTARDYFDAGVYGKAGMDFNEKRHKNFALHIEGAFYKALVRELEASRQRHLLKQE